MTDQASGNNLRQSPAEDDIDLLEIAAGIWAGRWIIALVVALFVLLASLYLHNATYRFTVTLKLSPVQVSGISAAGRMGGLGSMAALAGINLPQGSDGLDFEQFSDSIHSLQLAELLAQRPKLLQRVFPSEWDAERQQWQQKKGRLAPLTRSLKAVLGVPNYPWQAPDAARLADYLERNVKLIDSPDTPFITLQMEHEDPQFARAFLDQLARQLDDMLREKALVRTDRNIAYLSSQLSRVSVVEHRLAIVEALGQQERKRMLASSDAPYAADPLEPASTSIRPTSPRPSLLLMMAVLGGGLAGTVLVLIRNWWRDASREYRGANAD